MECLYRSFLHLVKIGKFVKQFDLCVLVLTVLGIYCILCRLSLVAAGGGCSSSCGVQLLIVVSPFVQHRL